jgi:mutator protein MutT
MRNFDFTFNYCPDCGTKDSVAVLDTTRAQCATCHMNFWNNPRAAVGLVLVKDGQMLFCKRAIEPLKGKYDFPGGFVEYNEDPYEALQREVKEETGITVRDLQLLHVGTHEYMPGVSTVDLLMVATEWEGEPRAGDDVASFAWKPIDILDSPEFAWHWPGLTDTIKRFEHRKLQ